MKPDDQAMIRPNAPSNALPPRLNNVAESSKDEKVALPMSLIKSFRRKGSGSGSSNGSGNNSDNSAIISIGNNSFGFNFDSEEAMMNASPPNSEKNGESDSEGNGSCEAKDPNANNQRQPATRPTEASTTESSHEEAAAAAVANLQSIASSYKTQGGEMEGT
jgi:hypothetical protein